MPGIQRRFSCNWKPPGPIWYCVSITRLSAKVMTLNASVSQRARCGRALPASSTMIAPRHGNQTSTLRMGQLLMRNPWNVACRPSVQSPIPEAAEQQDQPDDHRECVVIQEAGLQAPECARAAFDHRRRTVDHHAIQHRAVTALPERAAQLHAATRE